MQRSNGWATGWSIARIAAAAMIAVAVIAQFASSVAGALEAGRDVTTVVANFFSFFTILSNVSAAVVLLIVGLRFFVRGRRLSPEPVVLATALAWVTTYMLVTGVVYNLLLRGIPLQPETVPWSNEILHVWGPLFLLLDLFLAPGRRRLGWRAALTAAIFPVAWIVYTLLRAPLITNPNTGAPYWYPYPFLDPNTGGWGSVVVYVIVIAAVIVAFAVGAVAVGRWRGIRSS
ncbi:Pr6Pr family membrane protein [Microbacterium sp. VKM Ac-2923]|uniref:Pr6Pr family membrane protein n=1 Tax=Microbacterium sp. VKM Ac-2923 TaxID=2929476 RepID=UPI001FB42A50|nr:Pr6Pr family membrane protein [Microbacterium sp. VKM Ac-2923]MCJ1709055.1 Pr6Pr family membrane protein [Microbacterium sp. VKM Ac-2923]